jgi:hypothetical protein
MNNNLPQSQKMLRSSLILSAATALISSNDLLAESPPEHGVISYKFLDYQDRQDRLVDSYSGSSSTRSPDRIRVKAHSINISAPIAGAWLISAGRVEDSISGASPGYHSSRLKKLYDFREAYNLGITRYLPSGSISVGLNKSDENDYRSRGFSLLGSWHTENKNTTLNAGVAVSNDEIMPKEQATKDKRVMDWIVGITQVITMNDIAQFNLSYSDGTGYFSDPYKSGDRRPESKEKITALVKWNHYFESTQGSSHLSYRYYKDTFDIKAHTIDAEYTQPFLDSWTVTPALRFYTQSAAYFYAGVDPANPAFASYANQQYLSLDQRVGSFGAITWGLKVTKLIDANWLVDFKYENYTQKESWALSGGETGANVPFYFESFQVGISRKF